MMFSFDARTRELLRGIWTTGTLSAAAALIGMEASNAGRHLRIAERRSARMLVERRRGGRGGKNATLTAAGRRFLDFKSLQGVALAFQELQGVTPLRIGTRVLLAGGFVRPGPVEFEIRPEAVALERKPALASETSVRNRFASRVLSISEADAGVFRIGLASGALRLEALVVRGAVKDLNLRVGSRVYVSVKAVSIRATPRGPQPTHEAL